MTNSSTVEYIVTRQEAGSRLDRFIKERKPGVSRREVLLWMEEARITCNGKPSRKGTILRAGDRVALRLPQRDAGSPDTTAPDVSLRILYEDPFLVAVDKPSGIFSNPIREGEQGTLANRLMARFPEMQGVGFGWGEAGLLQRLDKGTSGVVLAARSQSVFQGLRAQFQKEGVEKIYQAAVHGRPESEGEISLPIGSKNRRAKRVDVSSADRPAARLRGVRRAETHFRVLCSSDTYSLVRLEMRTGARHQLRAHMSFLGHPVVGDAVYGSDRKDGLPMIGPARHLLHASEIRFVHPENGKRMHVRSPLPEDFRAFLRAHGLASS